MCRDIFLAEKGFRAKGAVGRFHRSHKRCHHFAGEEIWAGLAVVARHALREYPISRPLEEVDNQKEPEVDAEPPPEGATGGGAPTPRPSPPAQSPPVTSLPFTTRQSGFFDHSTTSPFWSPRDPLNTNPDVTGHADNDSDPVLPDLNRNDFNARGRDDEAAGSNDVIHTVSLSGASSFRQNVLLTEVAQFLYLGVFVLFYTLAKHVSNCNVCS